MKYANILEEEVKNKVTQDFFRQFDCTRILGKIDFAVKAPAPLSPPEEGKSPSEEFERTYLLWAEAKATSSDIIAMLTQLVLTIGKARTFNEILPPPFLGCYDSEKIAFIPYANIQDIFYQNDFNWKVTPSDSKTREFKQVYALIQKIVETNTLWETYIFDFEKDEKELKRFIRENFVIGKSETTKIRIDKNNFITIYTKWLEAVKPSIQVDWNVAKENGLIDADFYLADLISRENETLTEKLSILLHSSYYEAEKHTNKYGFFTSSRVDFTDNQKAYTRFWAKYERPPLNEYWEHILDHRHLLVPQDIRERKGSFYTPRIWVELSQKYLADTFGEDWQDEYYVWDCAAGTGNLLVGLTNKYNIWASTLDKADVDVMKQRIHNGANLLESHVFQFDFLNDDFTKLPQGLQEIINDPKRRKKLIIYINPPYKRGLGVANTKWHKEELGGAKDELFVQFIYRIYKEISGCKVGIFSKLKILNAPDFVTFRGIFKAKLKKLFVIPADTFDNVTGKFPIGFQIYDTEKEEFFTSIKADVFNADESYFGKKRFSTYANATFLNKWLISFKDKEISVGKLVFNSNDFQHQNRIRIVHFEENILGGDGKFSITIRNLIEASIYFAVRKVIPATWLNDRDQFLYPNNKWTKDLEFQNDCFAYTLFNNNISTKYGVNHWIPFTETEVNARDKFDSHFMASFINGKIIQNGYSDLFEQKEAMLCVKREFSPEATAVFDAGRELWKYYHTAIGTATLPPSGGLRGAVNASLYDIREHFQGRNDKGKMNNKSEDETYNELIGNLRLALNLLAKKIEPKVYEYGFLKE